MTNNKHSARQLTITDAQAGQRIDNFLLKQLKNVPKSHIYRLLRSGQVRVNSGRKKPVYKLKTGDVIRIPPVRLEGQDEVSIPQGILDTLSQSILHEDENLIAINKPSGIAVHKGSGLRFGIIEAMRELKPDLTLELVHRLDRGTSGCLLLAKNRQTLTQLHELLRHEKTVHIEKTYLALLDGVWTDGEKTIDIGLSKIKRGGEHMVQIDTHGDRAISHFEPVEIFTNCSLMKISIDTGRTHQIRVHSLFSGHPILGDNRYGNKASNLQFRKSGLKRLFLHAEKLYLPLHDHITVQAPLSKELEQVLNLLRQN